MMVLGVHVVDPIHVQIAVLNSRFSLYIVHFDHPDFLTLGLG